MPGTGSASWTSISQPPGMFEVRVALRELERRGHVGRLDQRVARDLAGARRRRAVGGDPDAAGERGAEVDQAGADAAGPGGPLGP